MTIPIKNLSEEDVQTLSNALPTRVTNDEAAKFAEQISSGLHWYEDLDSYRQTRLETEQPWPENIRFNPPNADDPLNAFITQFKLDNSDPEESSLKGISIAIKDNMAVHGVPLTCGSRTFESVIPRKNASVVDRLLNAGAKIVGKTNMDELAYGPTGETSQFGPTRNPIDQDRVPGGSSSGSGAAVGHGSVDAALGSDTGGSVRIPAAFCGVVGVKPSWGIVPRFGFIELAYTLDHIGPIAKDVKTAALVLDAIVGEDERDPSSIRARYLSQQSFVDAVANPPDPQEVTIGLPSEFFADHIQDGVTETIQTSLDQLENAGVSTTRTSIPTFKDVVAASNAISVSEFAAVIRSFGVPFQRKTVYDAVLQDSLATALSTHGHKLGDIAKRKMIEGEYLLDQYQGRHYIRAMEVCNQLQTEFESALQNVDVLVTPTLPTTPPKLGEWSADSYGEDVTIAVNTRPVNLVGLPAVTIPAGTHNELPVGLQCIGSSLEDISTLATARIFEKILG
jgi:amidase/aspartyl-tRNA(Asn)/glutamyl-tRNA(Gln) amidotransferase subunit A